MNKADKIFKENLQRILTEGIKDTKPRAKYSDGRPAHTIFITQVFEQYDCQKNEIPLITLRPQAWKSAIKEIFWIYQSQSNDSKDKYYCKWWDSWLNKEGTIGESYGWIVNQYKLIDKIIYDIKNNPSSKRIIMNLFQYPHLDKGSLYPCAYETLWKVRGEYLDMTLMQRSNDFCTASAINLTQYYVLLHMMAQVTGLKPGKFARFVNDMHIYDRHIEQAYELLNRTSSEKEPKLVINPNVKNFYDFKLKDINIIDYEPVYPQLKFELGI